MLFLSRSLFQVVAETADGGWASSRRRILLILQPREYPPHVWRKAISSSESPAPSATGVSERGIPKIVFPFRTLWIGEGSLPVRYFGFRPLEIEAVRGSLVEVAFEGGRTNDSTNWQSGRDDGEAWVIGALPYPKFGASHGFELCPESGTDLMSSTEHGTGHFRILLVRYSSASPGKNGFSPELWTSPFLELFRNW